MGGWRLRVGRSRDTLAAASWGLERKHVQPTYPWSFFRTTSARELSAREGDKARGRSVGWRER